MGQAGREAKFFVDDWGDGAEADNGVNALVEAKAVASGSVDTTCKVWEAETGRLLSSVEMGARKRLGAAFVVHLLDPELVRMVLTKSSKGFHE
ncbi:hypothetical protein T484DRAFT_1806572 [Baffinella frigidus]|nr:hypothetical protein T484DRAFT_1806572 [Cryptophyta sp. CCMP2293]